jgi:predicted metal-dependent hydrolase
MQIELAGITLDIQKKTIKNIHLSVLPPDGAVRVSAPENLSDEAIKTFLRLKISWIRTERQKFAAQARLGEREYISGESLFVFGQQYYLTVQHGFKNSLILKAPAAILTVRRESTRAQREKFVNSNLRELLKKKIAKRLPKWEEVTGLKSRGWQTKLMQSKWGSCNPEGKIWFNLLLAHVPPRCLDYIILHELLHLRVRRHNKEFTALLDKYMPNWPEVRRELNDFILLPLKRSGQSSR